MNDWLTPVTPLSTTCVIKLNGKPLTLPSQMKSESTSTLTAAYSQPLPFSLLALSLTAIHRLFEEVPLFKQSDEAIAASGWMKEPYVPIKPMPDFNQHLIPESMYQWTLTSLPLKEDVLNRLTGWFMMVQSQYTTLLSNLSHSAPVLIIILLTMTLFLINKCVKATPMLSETTEEEAVE